MAGVLNVGVIGLFAMSKNNSCDLGAPRKQQDFGRQEAKGGVAFAN
jgi:hypothetical protein